MMNMNNLAQTHEILTPQLATKVGLTKFEFYKYVKANEYEQVGHGVSSHFIANVTSIPLWTKINRPTAGRTKAIHRRPELSFNLYLLLLFVGQNRASKSLLHITLRIFRFLQFFNK